MIARDGQKVANSTIFHHCTLTLFWPKQSPTRCEKGSVTAP